MKPHINKIQIAIVSSLYWKDITNKLEENCLIELVKNGYEHEQIDVFHVPGSLEIPLIVKKLAKKNKYGAIIAFGAIHKGKTYHFEMIADECIRGCMKISLDYEIPVIFEVLAVYDIEDAFNRANSKKDNRGTEAAKSAISMINIISNI